MIRLDDPALYDASLAALERFAGRRYYGRLVQIFLACKHYGALIPPIGSSTGIDVGQFQLILDELYTKASRPPKPSVVSLFNSSHLFPTGTKGPGMSTASNIWRNNFNIQKGYGCLANAAELNGQRFRTQHRADCPHLRPVRPGSLEGATCEFANDATYRGEDHPKVFRIDPETGNIFVYDPDDVENYRPFVAPGGRGLPVVPLICAIYHDSDLGNQSGEVDVPDFMLDFNFSRKEFAAYFDDDPASPPNAELVRKFRGLSWTRAPLPGAAAPAAPAALPPGARRRGRPIPRLIPPEELPASTHPVAPPAGSRWWDAEDVVRTVLEAGDWTLIDRRRQSAGFDFQATKGGRTIFVEVKSSTGPCIPTLTAKEHREAARLGDRYILAVLENFDPTAAARILWAQNPAQLGAVARTVEVYPLPRATWLRHATVDITL